MVAHVSKKEMPLKQWGFISSTKRKNASNSTAEFDLSEGEIQRVLDNINSSTEWCA